jgi:hypothetical protein
MPPGSGQLRIAYWPPPNILPPMVESPQAGSLPNYSYLRKTKNNIYNYIIIVVVSSIMKIYENHDS